MWVSAGREEDGCTNGIRRDRGESLATKERALGGDSGSLRYREILESITAEAEDDVAATDSRRSVGGFASNGIGRA